MARARLRAAADRFRTHPRAYRLARRAYHGVQRRLPPVVVEGVPGRVHRNDLMHDVAHSAEYVWRALQVVEVVHRALVETGHEPAHADVLDFGCGYGRVTRHLVGRHRTVSACDIDHDGVRFCASEFHATPVFGSTDLGSVRLWHYDAIWLGSVVTHIPAGPARALLLGLADHVRPGGVLLVSRSGRTMLEAHLADPRFGWLRARARALDAELQASGATYATYPERRDGDYGLGFQTAAWLDATAAAAGLEPLFEHEADWAGQRIHAYRRPPTP